MAGISDDVENLRVNRHDFMNALDEVHPAFGVSEEELQQVIQNGIIHFDPVVDVRNFLRLVCIIRRVPYFYGRRFSVMGNSSLSRFARPRGHH